jgi:hypothetical protein
MSGSTFTNSKNIPENLKKKSLGPFVIRKNWKKSFKGQLGEKRQKLKVVFAQQARSE